MTSLRAPTGESTMNPICISSLVVQALPEKLPEVRKTLCNLADTEVLGENDLGKLVVVLDTKDNRAAADRITEIQSVEGVLSATLVYQYDDRIESQVEDSK
jgi:nitrate reductase NapD